jgi:carbonic anhydrase/acetyltransferase-like protein (isoleucine patch superfamily)
MPQLPKYIAGQTVRTQIVHTIEPWTIYPTMEAYYVLDNGAMVAVNSKIGEGVEVDFGVIIENGCIIGDRVHIGYLSRVGDQSTIGSDTTIESRVTIEHECRIGSNCRVDEECYIGSLNELPDGTHIGSISAIMYETLQGDEEETKQLVDTSIVAVRGHHKVLQVKDPTTVLDMSICELFEGYVYNGNRSFVKKVINCLAVAGIDTVRQLTEKTEDDLLAIATFGQRSLDVVEARLGELDLSLNPI